MHGHLVIVLAAAALMVLLAQAPMGDAVCCQAKYHFPNRDGRCADCSKILYKNQYCSRTGYCNGFGCDCDGGCKEAVEGRTCTPDSRQDRDVRRSRRAVSSAAIYPPTRNFTGHDVIIAGDLDKNGHLDEVEVHLYLTQRAEFVDDVTAWRKLDSNGDGKLTAAEIDPDLRSVVDVTAV